MERIVLHPSSRQLYRKLAFCLSVLGIGAGLLMLKLRSLIGWGLVALGGGYALVILRSLGEETEHLVIDDSGIRDSVLPVGTISWDEIRSATVQQIGSAAVVALEVRDPERFIRRLPAARQFIAGRRWNRAHLAELLG
jgi:hypothetical protein